MQWWKVTCLQQIATSNSTLDLTNLTNRNLSSLCSLVILGSIYYEIAVTGNAAGEQFQFQIYLPYTYQSLRGLKGLSSREASAVACRWRVECSNANGQRRRAKALPILADATWCELNHLVCNWSFKIKLLLIASVIYNIKYNAFLNDASWIIGINKVKDTLYITVYLPTGGKKDWTTNKSCNIEEEITISITSRCGKYLLSACVRIIIMKLQQTISARIFRCWPYSPRV